MEEQGRRSRTSEAFFGRRRGKTIRPAQAVALETGLQRYRLNLEQPAPAALGGLFEAPVSSIRLEIGFGGGEHLRQEVSTHPATGFIGAEPFVNGMAKMMMALTREPAGNLRVFDDDAALLLDWLPRRRSTGSTCFTRTPGRRSGIGSGVSSAPSISTVSPGS